MFVCVNEDDDDGKLAARIYQVRGLDLVAAKEAGYRMHRGRGVHAFFPQVVENLQMQWPVLPLVSFVEIERDLDCHCDGHFTAPAPRPFRLKPPGRPEDCW